MTTTDAVPEPVAGRGGTHGQRQVIGAFADRGWSERYNRLAVPTETGFVVALGAVLFFG